MPVELPSCWLGEGWTVQWDRATVTAVWSPWEYAGNHRVLGFVEIVLAVVLVTEQDKFSVDNQVKLLFGSVCPPFFCIPSSCNSLLRTLIFGLSSCRYIYLAMWYFSQVCLKVSFSRTYLFAHPLAFPKTERWQVLICCPWCSHASSASPFCITIGSHKSSHVYPLVPDGATRIVSLGKSNGQKRSPCLKCLAPWAGLRKFLHPRVVAEPCVPSTHIIISKRGPIWSLLLLLSSSLLPLDALWIEFPGVLKA